MTRKRKYKFLRGSSGHHGSVFQLKLLTLCLLRGLKRGSRFELSSENQEAAGVFDDVVYEEVDEGVVTGSMLMQAKHRQDGNKAITIEELFTRKSEFQISQYLSSFCKIKQGFPNILKVRLLTNVTVSRGNETDKHLSSIIIDHHDILYCTQAVTGYALTEQSQNRLKTQLPHISEDDLSDFLAKFQIICIPDTALDQEIKEVLKNQSLFDAALHEEVATANFIRGKIEQWYIKGSGDYLNNTDAKAYLCMWRSINHAQTLKKFNIRFRRRNINPGKRLVCLMDAESYILGLIKMYQQFFEENKKEGAIMIVNPEDDISIQRAVVEAFTVPECRLLIVPLYGDDSYNSLQIDELLQNISDKPYKTVVFFADKDTFTDNVPNAQVISLRTCFGDLEECCKNAFLDTTVDFQGKDVRLGDVLAPYGEADQIIDEQTLLMLSRGKKFKIENVHDDKGIGSIYIERTFVRGDQRYTETDLCDFIMTENDEKFVLISNGAGMGKTTVLTKITEILQQPPYPRRWVIRLDLNRYAKLFRELKQSGKESFQMEDILDSTRVLRSSFKKNLFNAPASVILITDAVDEVNAAYTTMVLGFLKNCFARMNIAKILVTTRPQLETSLENELKVSSFRLELFSPEDQIDFLTRYWTTNLGLREEDTPRCQLYTRSLMEKLNSSIGHASWSFIGIPLQTIMVADIFQHGSSQRGFEWHGCQEFLNSQLADVELNVDINVAKLYEMFVEKKGKVYVTKLNPDGTVEGILNEHYRRAIEVHKKLALQSILDPEKYQLFSVLQNVNSLGEQGLSAMGIVHEMKGTWIFTHQTFSEYFMAICLWDELASGRSSYAFRQFLFHHVLMYAKFSVVKSFFMNMMPNEAIPDDFSEPSFEPVMMKIIELELAETGRFDILGLTLERNSYRVWGNISHASTRYLSMVKYLVRKGAMVDWRNLSGESLLHEAVLNNCVDVVASLVEKGMEIEVKLWDGRTPLHLAAMKGFYDVAKLLIHADANIEAQEQNMKTPLHLAAEKNRVDVAKLLMEAGADVTAKTGNGRTAMDLAVLNESSAVVRLLRDHP